MTRDMLTAANGHLGRFRSADVAIAASAFFIAVATVLGVLSSDAPPGVTLRGALTALSPAADDDAFAMAGSRQALGAAAGLQHFAKPV